MPSDGRTKSAVREAVLAARRVLSPADRRVRSDQIARRVMGLEAFQRARCVALYAAIGAEVDPDAIARAAVARGLRTAFPRMVEQDRSLVLALCAPADLVPGPAGTHQPPPESPVAEPSSIDLVLVPGVAFDLACRRLGRGRGHYDATLQRLPARTMRVGLAFEVQLVPEVPSEPHDAPVDAVVTEARVVFRLPSGVATGRS